MTNFIYKDIIAERYFELQEQLLAESRVDFVKKQVKDKINTDHDSFAEHKDSDAIVDHFAEHGDPTKKKLYTGWIVKQYQKGNTRQEDTGRIRSSLMDFDKYKSKLPEKDINKYDSLKDIENAVQPHLGLPATNKERIKAENEAGHELKYEDDKIKIFHLKTKEASQNIYGGGVKAGKTNWCTAYREKSQQNPNEPDEIQGENRFDHYNKIGHLHVVHDKDTGKVYQYHVNENQFMDAHDNDIPHEDFMKIAPSLHKAWNENPDLLK